MLLERLAMAIPAKDRAVRKRVAPCVAYVMRFPLPPALGLPASVLPHKLITAATGVTVRLPRAFALATSSLPSCPNGLARERKWSHLPITSSLVQLQATFLTLFLAWRIP